MLSERNFNRMTLCDELSVLGSLITGSPKARFLPVVCATLSLALCSSPSRAGTAWKAAPGSGDWNTVGNWDGVLPASNQTVTFGSSSITAVNLSAQGYARAISINSTASNFTFTGQNLRLGDSGGPYIKTVPA